MDEQYIIISNLTIYAENKIYDNASVVILDNKIHAIISNEQINQYPSAQIYRFDESYSLIPGLIDLHIHGAAGADIMDATPEALTTISQALVKEGVTSFLATTMTAPVDEIEKALSAVHQFTFMQSPQGAKMLGVHLEGPFISPKKIGAQGVDNILLPDKSYIESWQNKYKQIIKLVTFAPELPGSVEFTQYLKQHNIIPSIGHTDATYAETQAAIYAGCSYATHLFNAMRGIHQREPGAAGAILLSDKVSGELIVDGVHLHPGVVEMALRLKGVDKLTLVSDAMRAKCLGDGEYELGGQAVTVRDGEARLEDGTLAGSTLRLNQALKNLVQFTNCSLGDAIRMGSENPAKIMGVYSKKGGIALNKDADLVVMDKDFNVVLTVIEGNVINIK